MSEKTREITEQLRATKQLVKTLEAQLHEERKTCDHQFVEFELPDLPGKVAKVCSLCEKFVHPLGIK